MAQIRASFQDAPFGIRRMVEWMIVAGIILLLVWVFARQLRVLQGQVELSAVKTTLAALRTALVIDHLRKSAASDDTAAALAQHNPFELLQRYPVNYIGEMNPEQAALAPSGTWVFDPNCVCVGYQPIWGEWLDSTSGALMPWFRISAVPGSFLQLTAKENYRWQGQALN